MDQLIQTIAAGLADGSVYGALALAIALIYRSTGVINFAQGEMAMLSTFGAYALIQGGFPVVLAIIAVALGSGVVGMAFERVVIRPVESRDELSIVILTIGVLILIDAAALQVWGPNSRNFPSMFGDGIVTVFGTRLGWDTIGTVLTLVGVLTAVWYLLERTDIGLAMRAAATDPSTARLLGVKVDRTLMLGWGSAAAVGALAGALIAPNLFLNVNFMSGVLIYALAAASLGGLDSPFGAVIGGWVVGLAESITVTYLGFIGPDLGILVPLAVIVVVLMVRPSGLFGHAEAVRV
jgi:branched-chain amino acid transport system permease protein